MMSDEEKLDQEMYEAATLLGNDREMTDISYATSAQEEVMLEDDQLQSGDRPGAGRD